MKTLVNSLFLLLISALLGTHSVAYAEPVDKSVKEWLSNSENKKEIEHTPLEKEPVDIPSNKVGVTFFDFIKMIFATLFVIALLYAVLKFVSKKSKSFQSNQLIENLGGASLGSNRSVQLVKVGKQILVVGVGENIHLLKEINDQEEYRQIIETYNKKMEQLIQPSDIVTKLLGKTKKSKSRQHEESQFATMFKKQLNDFSNGRKKMLKEMEKEVSDE